jgi:predicted amidohydrolase
MDSQSRIFSPSYDLTVKDYIENILDFRTAEDWLLWPPNTFVVTHLLLSITGGYRAVIYQKIGQKKKDYQKDIEELSKQWLTAIGNELENEFFAKRSNTKKEGKKTYTDLEKVIRELIKRSSDVSFNELRIITHEKNLRHLKTENSVKNQKNPYRSNENACNFLEKVAEVHAIADEACAGLGVSGTSASRHSPLFHYVANLLLISTGSFATYPKQIGIVLPKMRTPQQGINIRGLSHNITFHATEVEVIWRSFPWANITENSLNILAFCWPNKIDNDFFETNKPVFSDSRYFSYKEEQGEGGFDPTIVIENLRAARKEGIDRVHIIVFPEVAMNDDQWTQLLSALQEDSYYTEEGTNEKRRHHIPMVISGIHEKDKNKGDRDLVNNELRIASFFAGRWYYLRQEKHHRWKLDRSQINTYGLSSKLSANKDWIEEINLEQRRLTIICPNGWLSIAPLICEDLARLDPVSEVIRGMGPTLLLALLADGPQLKRRWSARYASVFADDPGTSVLSLTSLGMANKSQPRQVENNNKEKHEEKVVVGLWKDQINQFQQISIDKSVASKKYHSFLLTVSTKWGEEFTLDKRSDHSSSATLQFDSVKEFDSASQSPNKYESNKPLSLFKKKVKKWVDIKEISATSTLIDCLIELSNTDIEYSFEGISKFFTEPEPESETSRNFHSSIIGKIKKALTNPRDIGTYVRIKDGENEDEVTKTPTASLTLFLGVLSTIHQQILADIKNQIGKENPTLTFFEVLNCWATRTIDSTETSNINWDKAFIHREQTDEELATEMKYACHSQILITLHNKIEYERRKVKHYNSHDTINISELEKLFKQIEDTLIILGY